MNFTGHSEHSIDAKQRLAIPAKYRKTWNEKRDGTCWVCIPWPGGVLRLYTENTFEALASQGAQSLTPFEELAQLQSDLFSLAERLEMDAQGRICIPRTHLELTGLSGEVMVLGSGNRLEVKDRDAWIASMPERFKNLPTLVRQIEERRTNGTA